MNIEELYDKIGETRLTQETPKGPTLDDMHVTQEKNQESICQSKSWLRALNFLTRLTLKWTV